MRQKEKAKELIERFSNEAIPDAVENDLMVIKKCALICVDEILIALILDDWGDGFRFYEEVKQEIEKL